MPKHDVMHKQVAQQRSANFASKCAALFPIHVLRAHLNVLRFAERFHHFCNRSERRHNHHFHIGDFAEIQQHRFDKSRRLRLGHVHLPISGNDFLSHVIQLSFRAKRGISRLIEGVANLA